MFNKKLIHDEYKQITRVTKNRGSTRISDGLQISGSKVFNWKWIIIEKK